MKIDSEICVGIHSERELIHQIAHQLDQWRDYQPVPPLPEGYRPSRIFGGRVLMNWPPRPAVHDEMLPEPRSLSLRSTFGLAPILRPNLPSLIVFRCNNPRAFVAEWRRRRKSRSHGWGVLRTSEGNFAGRSSGSDLSVAVQVPR